MNPRKSLSNRLAITYLLAFAGSFFSLVSCQTPSSVSYPVPPSYDLNHPYKMEMPVSLNEISGVVFYTKDTSVFAISDASGSLYKVLLKKNLAIKKWKFGKNADYEDLQLVDSTFYILSSSGNIVKLTFYSADSLNTEMFIFPDKAKNEFESLYYDKEAGTLNLMCKDCDADKKKSVSTWTFHIKDNTYSLSAVPMDVAPIAKSFGLEKIKFKPSAAAINPATNELYVLSSVNKALVITDRAGQVKEVFALDPHIYKQPEGLAFTPTGDLLISNEAGDTGNANILIIKRKPVTK